MDGLPLFMGDKVLETGVIYQPAGDGKVAYIHREDLAEASVVILTGEGHENKAYDFGSDSAYSYSDIATILSQLTGKTISYVSPDKDEFIKTLSEAGVPKEYIMIFAGFAEGIKQGEFEETSTYVEKLIGRKPIEISAYLKSVYVK
jgi:NAD(P)H dehydrogenase (quinone)